MSSESRPFVLRLRPSDESWMHIALRAPDGGNAGERIIDWSGEEAWYSLTGDRRAVYDRIENSPPEDGDRPLAELGRILYDGVFGENLGVHLIARARQGGPVQLQIICPPEYPRLLTLPWQILHDGQDFLYRQGISIAARLPGNEARVQAPEGPFRALIVFASPRDAEVPPVEAEIRALEDMYRRLPLRAHVTELSYGVTAEDIENVWRRAGGFHAIHMLSPATDDRILLEGPGGCSAPLAWSVLERTFRKTPAPWLVTLGTGRLPRDPWRLDYEARTDGVAERSGAYEFGQPHDWSAVVSACARAGVPATLVYQLPIAALPGRAVAERFCGAILSGQASVGEAWRSAVEDGIDVATDRESMGAPPALVGRGELRLRSLSTGPTVIPERARRDGIDVGVFPHKPTGRNFVGRYHTTTRFLREVLFGRDHSAVVVGPPGVGKTTLAVNVLRLAADTIAAVRYGSLRLESTVETFYAGVASFCAANGWPLPLPDPRRAGHPDPVVRAEVHAECISQALRGRRAIVIVDDVERSLVRRDGCWQLQDPALGLALRHLITHLEGSGVWLLSEHLPSFGAEERPERLTVVPLTEPQPRSARELFEQRVPLRSLDTNAQRTVYLATRGLPGLLGALATLQRRGELHELLAGLVPEKLHSESHDAFRPRLCEAVTRAVFEALPLQAQQLLVFASLCEKPERTIVAEKLGLVVDPELVRQLVDADLLDWWQPSSEGEGFAPSYRGFLWTSPMMTQVARRLAADIGIDVADWRERIGSYHAANGIEMDRAAAAPGLSEGQRLIVGDRSRLSFLRAFSYFIRAAAWRSAVDMLLRAAPMRRDPPYRSELRRMAATLAERAELPPELTADVLEVLATLDEDESATASAADHLERAVWVARMANDSAREAALLFHLAELLSLHGGHERAEDAVRAAARAWRLSGDGRQRCRALLSRLTQQLDRTDLAGLWHEATGEPLPVDILPLQ